MAVLGIGKMRLIHEICLKTWKQDPLSKQFTYREMLYLIQEMLEEEGKQYLEPKSDKFGYVRFREFVKHLLYRNIANFDTGLLITGDKGMSKSSTAIMLGKMWMYLQGRKFDPKRHIAYNNVDVMRKIDILSLFEVLICDESIRFITTENWNRAENKNLKIKLGQIRTKHLFVIYCFPLKIQKVDKVYLESYINYWVELFSRGLGAVFVKDKNPSRDSWRIKEFGNIGAFNEFTDSSQIEKMLKKHPNFWMTMRFPRPSNKLYEQYLKIREKNVYDDENVMSLITKEDIGKALLLAAFDDVMKHDSTLTMNRIILHIKNEYDINLSKSIVEAAISDARQLILRVREDSTVINK